MDELYLTFIIETNGWYGTSRITSRTIQWGSVVKRQARILLIFIAKLNVRPNVVFCPSPLAVSDLLMSLHKTSHSTEAMHFPHLAWLLTWPLVALQSRADFYMDAETHLWPGSSGWHSTSALFRGEMANKNIYGNEEMKKNEFVFRFMNPPQLRGFDFWFMFVLFFNPFL